MAAPTPEDLTEYQSEVIGLCLRAAVDGPFFPDWEFETIMGFSRDDVRTIAMAWPDEPAELSEEYNSLAVPQRVAANNAMNLLLSYPHRIEGSAFVELVGTTEFEIEEALREWRGETTFDPTARGAFNRMM